MERAYIVIIVHIHVGSCKFLQNRAYVRGIVHISIGIENISVKSCISLQNHAHIRKRIRRYIRKIMRIHISQLFIPLAPRPFSPFSQATALSLLQ